MSSTPFKPSSSTSPGTNVTPYQLRTLVLDYLCHHSYTDTARAFAAESAVRHVDADGDDIMQPPTEIKLLPGELSESVLHQVQLREEIQQSILCGKVQQAIDQLEQYFPFVLANGPSPPPFARYKADYLPTTSIEPEILMLNLRILELIESCRTIPLPYPPSSPSESGVEMHSPESYTAILNKAKKLYARAGMLSNRQDQQSFHIELQNVISLLAHKVPEHSSVSHYLAQARRDAVAAEVNSAILFRTGMPVISYLELHTRQTATLWSFLHDMGIKPRLGAPLPPQPDAVTTPKASLSRMSRPIRRDTDEAAPHFSLQALLDSKT